jgi:hypothetical protein
LGGCGYLFGFTGSGLDHPVLADQSGHDPDRGRDRHHSSQPSKQYVAASRVKRIGGDLPFCKMTASKETEWSYRMEGGFDVYWEQRKKARPAFLRIIQAFFGN